MMREDFIVKQREVCNSSKLELARAGAGGLSCARAWAGAGGSCGCGVWGAGGLLRDCVRAGVCNGLQVFEQHCSSYHFAKQAADHKKLKVPQKTKEAGSDSLNKIWKAKISKVKGLSIATQIPRLLRKGLKTMMRNAHFTGVFPTPES
ncbi:unnamed protein product [Dovyalis caffra]|uniref:Uncharacterized protein n=1 Tax=Dovyalis caffra TaxID=77055 RepID=A0AAV1RUR7_9ROSI|nr:unnamed protein product [Dovyalis caffra]